MRVNVCTGMRAIVSEYWHDICELVAARQPLQGGEHRRGARSNFIRPRLPSPSKKVSAGLHDALCGTGLLAHQVERQCAISSGVIFMVYRLIRQLAAYMHLPRSCLLHVHTAKNPQTENR